MVDVAFRLSEAWTLKYRAGSLHANRAHLFLVAVTLGCEVASLSGKHVHELLMHPQALCIIQEHKYIRLQLEPFGCTGGCLPNAVLGVTALRQSTGLANSTSPLRAGCS